MDIKELLEQRDREDTERAALLATLPQDVQSVLNSLPEEGLRYLLDHIKIINDPSQVYQRPIRSGMFMGAIAYAFVQGQLGSASYQCLCDFEQTLSAAPA